VFALGTFEASAEEPFPGLVVEERVSLALEAMRPLPPVQPLGWFFRAGANDRKHLTEIVFTMARNDPEETRADPVPTRWRLRSRVSGSCAPLRRGPARRRRGPGARCGEAGPDHVSTERGDQ
jgi:hypothetical protein